MARPIRRRARRALIQAFTHIAALVPLKAYEAIGAIERLCQALQGTHWLARCDLEARAIVSLLPARGAVVVDAGANRALWTRSLLKLATDRVAQVYALEPIESLARRMNELALPSVEVIQIALSDRTGVLTLHVPRNKEDPAFDLASAYRRAYPEDEVSSSIDEPVWATTLDELAAVHGWDRIDFLKMDIEGHEMAALRGAAGLLAAGRIRALSFELGECDVASRTFLRDFWDLLSAHGFRFYRITYGGRLYPVTRYTTHLERFGKSNYVAALG